jgi:hypothetical protein
MGSGSQTDAEMAAYVTAKDYNESLSTYLFIILGAVSVAVIIWRVTDVITKYTRTVTCLANDRQRYFAIPSPNLSLIKRHVLYAPVLSKRHNREIQLSSAVNVGTLPTRFQLLFLTGYLATNVAFCVIAIPFAGDYTAATTALRNRSGALATANMVRGLLSLNFNHRPLTLNL